MSDTLNSPQGDGNPLIGIANTFTKKWSDTLNSPQGDGNSTNHGFRLFRRQCQTPSIPRKGTETILNRLTLSLGTLVSQTPSIPRKGTETTISSRYCSNVNPEIGQTPSIPRKGTETQESPSCHTLVNMSDTLNSPQGDGNVALHLAVGIGVAMSDTLNSPQGDGNGEFVAYAIPVTLSDTLNSPQGDGNLTRPVLPSER